jgi:hypothetical protein
VSRGVDGSTVTQANMIKTGWKMSDPLIQESLNIFERTALKLPHPFEIISLR